MIPADRNNFESNILEFKKNKLLFQIANHHELFRLGESFLHDFKQGIQSFGFSSIGYDMSQKRTVLGLACFFDFKNVGKIAIISDSFEQGIYSEVMKHSHKVVRASENGHEFEVSSFADNFDLIDMTPLLGRKGLETIQGLRGALSAYDLVLWDLPRWLKLQEDPQSYLAMIFHLQSLSVIVTPSLSKNEEIKKAKQFFMDYGVSLKGFILDTHLESKSPPKEESA